MFRQFSPFLAAVTILFATALSHAGSPFTWIVCHELCGGCEKKITAKLLTLPDVESIECDARTQTVKVIPKPGTRLSPFMLWSTLEDMGKRPVSLSGPSGTFTTRPSR